MILKVYIEDPIHRTESFEVSGKYVLNCNVFNEKYMSYVKKLLKHATDKSWPL